jgi:hypothetical protein
MQIGIGGNAATLKAIVDEAVAAEAGGLATWCSSNAFARRASGSLPCSAGDRGREAERTVSEPAHLRRHDPHVARRRPVRGPGVDGGARSWGVSEEPHVSIHILGATQYAAARD